MWYVPNYGTVSEASNAVCYLNDGVVIVEGGTWGINDTLEFWLDQLKNAQQVERQSRNAQRASGQNLEDYNVRVLRWHNSDLNCRVGVIDQHSLTWTELLANPDLTPSMYSTTTIGLYGMNSDSFSLA
jgi:hypothetical protein